MKFCTEISTNVKYNFVPKSVQIQKDFGLKSVENLKRNSEVSIELKKITQSNQKQFNSKIIQFESNNSSFQIINSQHFNLMNSEPKIKKFKTKKKRERKEKCPRQDTNLCRGGNKAGHACHCVANSS